MDVAVHFEKIVAGFSRSRKYTLGSEQRNASRGIVILIIQANNARDKAPQLRELCIRLDELLVPIRPAKEVKAVTCGKHSCRAAPGCTRAARNFKSYQYVLEQVNSVCRQNEGWLKSVEGSGSLRARFAG